MKILEDKFMQICKRKGSLQNKEIKPLQFVEFGGKKPQKQWRMLGGTETPEMLECIQNTFAVTAQNSDN